MNKLHRPLALAALIGFSFPFSTPAQTGGYVETDLVVNKKVGAVPTLVDRHGVTHIAQFFDPNLVNPWGIGESAGSPFWISDNNAGVSTLYNTAGIPQGLVVSIPSLADLLGTGGAPDGRCLQHRQGSGSFQDFGCRQLGESDHSSRLFPFRHGRRDHFRVESEREPGGF